MLHFVIILITCSYADRVGRHTRLVSETLSLAQLIHQFFCRCLDCCMPVLSWVRTERFPTIFNLHVSMSSIHTLYHGFYVVALLIFLFLVFAIILVTCSYAHRDVRHPRQGSETLNRPGSDLFFLRSPNFCCEPMLYWMRTERFPTIFKLHVTMSSINALYHRLYALVYIQFLWSVFFFCGLSLHALLS